MSISDAVLKRIIKLASKGYFIRFSPEFGDNVQIHIRKHDLNAYHIVSIDEIERSKFDILLYTINRLVQMVDERL